MSRKVALISFHHYLTKRKAGFHWIAHSFEKMGWRVAFITAPLSPFSRLIHDHRWMYVNEDRNNSRVLNDLVTIYTYCPLFSPLSKTGNLILDLCSQYFIPLYQYSIPRNLQKLIQDADVIIFESTAAILLFELCKEINPKARYIYRVSDSLEILKVDTKVLEYEKKIVPLFDLVSVPSRALHSQIHGNNVHLQYHGIQKDSFNRDLPCPISYGYYDKNLVFVGNSFFDLQFITIVSSLFPEYGFHLIGPISYTPKTSNVILYGEIPFEDTIPYLLHADVGLQIRRMDIGLGTLSDSLKVLQYTWCRLPIIAPEGLDSDRRHIFYYKYDDSESISRAVKDSVSYNHDFIDCTGINDWTELVTEMLRKVEISI